MEIDMIESIFCEHERERGRELILKISLTHSLYVCVCMS